MFFKSSCQFKTLFIIGLCSGCTVYFPPTTNPKTPVPSSPQNLGTLTVQTAAPGILVQPESYFSEYTVKKGDTLYGIARQFGCAYTQLAQWNHLSPANSMGSEPHYNLFPGQHLQVKNCR